LVPTLLGDLGRGDLRVPAATFTSLRRHSWPGNVRELKNTLAYALAFVEKGGALQPQHLGLGDTPGGGLDLERLPLGGHPLQRIECAAITQTLAQTGGNKVQAAELLGIAVSTLYAKLKKYGL
jgi:transcriptional regulator with PAS, ATPase and Fis domain